MKWIHDVLMLLILAVYLWFKPKQTELSTTVVLMALAFWFAFRMTRQVERPFFFEKIQFRGVFVRMFLYLAIGLASGHLAGFAMACFAVIVVAGSFGYWRGKLHPETPRLWPTLSGVLPELDQKRQHLTRVEWGLGIAFLVAQLLVFWQVRYVDQISLAIGFAVVWLGLRLSQLLVRN